MTRRGPAVLADPQTRQLGYGVAALKNGTRSTSDGFRDHIDGAAGAFGGAKPAALAIIVIEAEAVAGAQFDHRIVRADAVAVVALEAIATGKTPARLVKRVGLVKPALYLLKSVLPAGAFEHRPHRLRRIGVIPAIELVETRQLVLFCQRMGGAAQPGVDMKRRFL